MFPLILHLFYMQHQAYYTASFDFMLNSYTFLYQYDSTILYQYHSLTGQNYLQSIKELWLEGYGGQVNISESFNAIRNSDDSEFGLYFQEESSWAVHNQLYSLIQEEIENQASTFILHSYLAYGIILLGMGLAVLDCTLSLRYIFKIERRVSRMLINFLVVPPESIESILGVADSFSIMILHEDHQAPKKEARGKD